MRIEGLKQEILQGWEGFFAEPEDLHGQGSHMVDGETDSFKFFSDLHKRPYNRWVSLVMDLGGYGADQRKGMIDNSD